VQDAARQRDRTLIDRVASGDRSAFAELVREHGPSLRRFARHLTHDGAADDILQDALLDAFRGAPGFRGESSVRSWLFTLLRHRALRQRATQSKREVPDSPLLELGVAAGWGCGALPRFEELEDRDTLNTALAQLGDEEREILMLRDVEGLSGEEAASVLGLELAAMKSRLHRARLRLMKVLREIGGKDG